MLPSAESSLQMAEDGAFAIGAFNLYNLEGAMAVAASESQARPA